MKKNKDAQGLAKLSVKKRKATKPKSYWVALAKSGAAARWKGHKKLSTDNKEEQKGAS